MLKKKLLTSFQRIIEFFTQKFVTKLSKIWVWDPGAEIRDPAKNLFRIPVLGPGVKKAPDPESRIRIRNTDSNIRSLKQDFEIKMVMTLPALTVP